MYKGLTGGGLGEGLRVVDRGRVRVKRKDMDGPRKMLRRRSEYPGF